MIEFCPRCRCAIVPVRRDGRLTYGCSKCDYISDTSRKFVKTLDEPEPLVYVVDKKGEIKTKPKEQY